MSAVQPSRITSRDNPLLAKLRKLARDAGAYRQAGAVWLDGEHLCSAAAQRGRRAVQAVVAESAWQRPALRELAARAERVAIVPDALYASISALPSPTGLGYVLPLDAAPAIDPHAPTVVLDRVQDAGNVGSVLRSAAAFGVRQVLALEGTATLWSPKVLRAGMGAHFALALVEALQSADLAALAVPFVGTSSHAAQVLGIAALPRPCAWIFSHEGQGIDAALLARCALVVRIPQPGGEESLNVAAAAAVCLYEAVRDVASAG